MQISVHKYIKHVTQRDERGGREQKLGKVLGQQGASESVSEVIFERSRTQYIQNWLKICSH